MKTEYVLEAKKIWNHTTSTICASCGLEIPLDTSRKHTYTSVVGVGSDGQDEPYGDYCPGHDARTIKRSIAEALRARGMGTIDTRSIKILTMRGLHQ